jgi:hypothetical protein
MAVVVGAIQRPRHQIKQALCTGTATARASEDVNHGSIGVVLVSACPASPASARHTIADRNSECHTDKTGNLQQHLSGCKQRMARFSKVLPVLGGPMAPLDLCVWCPPCRTCARRRSRRHGVNQELTSAVTPAVDGCVSCSWSSNCKQHC